ncbi:MAG TPA: sulfotransferase family 2 domain-containing protein [Mycobacteriales bacterium]|nr:sulfotransferase family 2 domain-containing protein [Mycobacteriales bacterium]
MRSRLIRLRKSIYRLEASDWVVARVALRALLAAYQGADRVFLRRASRPDYRSEKLISQDRKFMCVLVPKCGSRTLISGLRTAAAAEAFDLTVYERDIRRVPHVPSTYFTFAFVRDPWARCYSCYVQKIRQRTPIKAALHLNGRIGLHPDMSFSDFVHWLGSAHGSDGVADRHWMSQHRILRIHEGYRYDFIGRVESMESDLQTVASRLGFSASVFSHVLQATAPEEYLRHFTPELANLVGERYKEDVELFGYSAPNLAL